jgi:ubiquinone/menaquinone biosynthesis C-methylase UbiE
MEINFIAEVHSRTKRDYLGRVNAHDKATVAAIAKRFDKDYWDGERHTGYGGYRYDGRWRPVAERMAAHYRLRPGERILDVGCGKGFLLYEFTQVVPGVEVVGLDISHYGLVHAKPEVVGRLVCGHAARLPFPSRSFDFVVSLGTLHNLPIQHLKEGIAEIARVARGPRSYIMVESWRNEREKMNLLYWQLTCEAFFDTKGWEWLYARAGYRGDHGYIFFE